MKRLHIIAITHKKVELDEIGKFHIEDIQLKKRISFLKNTLILDELMYLSTCNRVEFVFSVDKVLDRSFLVQFFKAFNPLWNDEEVNNALSLAEIFNGENAVNHLFKVASSLDSLVIGEREIITQVRKAYELCNSYELTGDVIRLLVQRTIQLAKKIYTESDISKNPVSIVSLAYHQLKQKNINKDSNFIIVGAGKTISTMLKFLSKHGYNNFSIYNRNKINAEKLVKKIKINAQVEELSSLKEHRNKFDVIITCTGATDFIFNKEIYNKILNDDSSKKLIIDLALPNDFDPKIEEKNNVEIIAIEDLKNVAKENLKKRAKEINKCQFILDNKLAEFRRVYKERELERAMSIVPSTIKNITTKAYSEVFVKELENLDEGSREVLDNFVQYLEKKYISIPMKMAKDILLKEKSD